MPAAMILPLIAIIVTILGLAVPAAVVIVRSRAAQRRQRRSAIAARYALELEQAQGFDIARYLYPHDN